MSDLVLHLSISSSFSFPYGHPVAAYAITQRASRIRECVFLESHDFNIDRFNDVSSSAFARPHSLDARESSLMGKAAEE